MIPTHLHIFTTGGTIDKTYFDAKSEFQIGDPAIAELLPEANVAFSYEVTSVMRKDSLDMMAEDRDFIAAAIEKSPCSHILVTHGTDRMIETGKRLQGIAGKTIVLVGSMQPAKLRYSDAIFNIGYAVAAAQILPAGVYIAMNGQLFTPDSAVKNVAANRFEVFRE